MFKIDQNKVALKNYSAAFYNLAGPKMGQLKAPITPLEKEYQSMSIRQKPQSYVHSRAVGRINGEQVVLKATAGDHNDYTMISSSY